LLYSLAKIAKIIDGKLVGDAGLVIRRLHIDSRTIKPSGSGLFFAIKTKYNNGYNFISDAIKNGAVAVVCEQPTQDVPNYVLVSNTVDALQKLAKFHREKYAIPVVGITGSNGKTIVKEWLYSLVKESFNVCKSPRSYNSQIGVPISLWKLNDHHSLGIFEAGISKPGEMANLEQMVQPTIGVFTHLGVAHLSNFKNQETLLHEKLILFKNTPLIVCLSENTLVLQELQKLNKTLLVVGEEEGCDLHYEVLNNKKLRITHQQQTITIKPPFTDKASLHNLLLATATSLALGIDLHTIKSKLEDLPEVDMRLQQVEGINNNQLILDHYTSDLTSLEIALDFLDQQQNKGKKTVILSDIELPNNDIELAYKKINTLLKKYNISQLIGVGKELMKHRHLFSMENEMFPDVQSLLQQFAFYKLKNRVVLLKGARKFAFENITEKLQKQSHQTVLEVNLSQMQRNLNAIKAGLRKETKVMAMTKALSYGTGGFQIAKLLEYNNVDYLGVAYTDEAVQLKNAGISTPVFVLNADLNDLSVYEDFSIEPVIFSFEGLDRVDGKDITIHIELDTGMHRLGFQRREIPKLLRRLSLLKNVKIGSVFSHLPVADSMAKDEYTKNQIKRFKDLSNQIQDVLKYPVLRHISNSAGIERFPEAQMDMVRLGIGLYGISSVQNSAIQPVSTFKSYITQIKEVEPGEGIGYGLLDASTQKRRIAVIAVGYADGYSRKFSRGVGTFLIRGQEAPVVGNVCMDMTMCDVTDIECSEGDEAIIFGDVLSIEKIADRIGSIPYEVLTSVSERVNRIYYQE
jgi:alanine racemase